MKRISRNIQCLLLVVIMTMIAFVTDPMPMMVKAEEISETEETSLKDLYEDAFYMGVAAPDYVIRTEPYKSLVREQFNSMTMENEMKPDYIMDKAASIARLDIYKEHVAVNFNACKNGLDFAKENGISVRGHVLVWHSQTPDWFFYENYDTNGQLAGRDLMLKRMENYIKDVIAYTETNYPGVIYAWDVVNEAIADPWGIGLEAGEASPMRQKDSLWYQTIGKDFVEKAFSYARKYTEKYAPDHKIKLFYNDYNEYFEQKTEGIIQLLTPVRKAGNLDGIGMQSHIDVGWGLYGTNGYMTALRKFSEKLGVEIQVTELDIGMSENDTEASQGEYYQEFMEALLAEKYRGADITSVTIWGLSDDLSWRKDKNCLLFRKDLSKKPAYDGLVLAAKKVQPSEKTYRKKASAVDALIDKIGTVHDTEASKQLIDTARGAYDALNEIEQGFVTKLSVLEQAEAEYKALAEKKSEDTKKPADNKESPSGGTTDTQPDRTTGTQPDRTADVQPDEDMTAHIPIEGGIYTVGKYKYRVIGLKDKTAAVVGTAKKAKTITVRDTVMINNVSFQIVKIEKNAFKGNKKVTAVKIGKNVQTIGANAFHGCTNLKKVTINSRNLRKIETKAFYACKKLNHIKIISTKLKSVGKKAFKGIKKNAKIDVPDKKEKSYKRLFRIF